MIPRYTRKEMGEIWTDENKFQAWLQVEVAVLKTKEMLNLIPIDTSQRVKDSVKVHIKRIEEIEKTTLHDMMAFVQSIAEQLLAQGLTIEARHFHAGMTSYDIEDTALGILLRDSIHLIGRDMEELSKIMGQIAKDNKNTVQIGRTHGIHAEPITFGFKIANWYEELQRHRVRLEGLKKAVAVGKISGAVGTYANIDPRIEEITCQLLGLTSVPISTQIISRDRHAEYICTLALIAGSLGKFAVEIRNLHRTEIAEVSEPFKKGQKGSSAMPHKKNPVSSENISSLTRLMRGYVVTALENQETWHERDLANSANERIILADSSILIDYMVARLTNLLKGLVIRPERMEENLMLTKGAIFSEQVMLALAEKGVPREAAHDLVQQIVLRAMEEGKDFRELVHNSPEILSNLSIRKICQCFDARKQLQNIDVIFFRLGLVKTGQD